MLIQEARRRQAELLALLLTGYADTGVRLAVEDASTGSTALLRKPVSGVELTERAAALLAHAAARRRALAGESRLPVHDDDPAARRDDLRLINPSLPSAFW